LAPKFSSTLFVQFAQETAGLRGAKTSSSWSPGESGFHDGHVRIACPACDYLLNGAERGHCRCFADLAAPLKEKPGLTHFLQRASNAGAEAQVDAIEWRGPVTLPALAKSTGFLIVAATAKSSHRAESVPGALLRKDIGVKAQQISHDCS